MAGRPRTPAVQPTSCLAGARCTALSSVISLEWLAVQGNPLSSQGPAWNWYQLTLNSSERWGAYSQDGALCGAWLGKVTGQRELLVDRIQVDEQWRGLGVGRWLLGSCAVRAMELGVEVVGGFALPDVADYYRHLGASSRCLKGYPKASGLVAFCFEGSALAALGSNWP